MVREIVQTPNASLNVVCAPVKNFDGALHALADDLNATRLAHTGLGLAAPQIGVAERVIALNPGKTVGHRIMVNPELVKHGNNQNWGDEGCLSIGEGKPRFRLKRWDTITVRFQNLKGETLESTARGEAARIIQHEIDHLNGKLIA